MNHYRNLVLAFAGLALFCLFASGQSADLTGTWIGSTDVPDEGTDDLTLSRHSGRFSGRSERQNGDQERRL
jgi:hypothetical protein